MTDFGPFSQVEFVDNPEPRCPCILLLDVSYSMSGPPIDQLNAGVQVYIDELMGDSVARKRVEVAIITFGGTVRVEHDFATAEQFQAPVLAPNGATPMGAAVNQAIDMLRARKDEYKKNGILYYRPWLFLITDGAPTDEWRTAAQRVQEGEEAGAFMFFPVGVEGADFETLKQIGTRTPLKLKGMRFRDLFQWLSASQRSVSRSNPGDKVPLKRVDGPDGWAEICV